MRHITYCRLCSSQASASCCACHLPYLQEQYTASSRISSLPIVNRPKTMSVSSTDSHDRDCLLLSTSAPAEIDETIHAEPPSDLENSFIANPTDSLYISFPLDPPQQTLYQRLLAALGFNGPEQESHVAAGVLREMKEELGREVTSDKLTIATTQQQINEVGEGGAMVASALERRRQELRESQINPRHRSHGPSLMSEISTLRMEVYKQERSKATLEEKVRRMITDLKDKERLHQYLQRRYSRARSTV
ncbi:uncharacterized protein BDV14DRAFT_202267 [Aspergillus stella-maris]|uniref:uncharacterized protein n=1 Tax=Aspergillus stella-maris TaxID=1810926 RepID=UPI003CCE334E